MRRKRRALNLTDINGADARSGIQAPAVWLHLWLYCGCHNRKHPCGRSISSSHPRRTCTTRTSSRIQRWILTWVVIATTQLLPLGYAHKGVVMVKGLQVLDMCIRLPSVVSGRPSTLNSMDLPTNFMADYFVEPAIRHRPAFRSRRSVCFRDLGINGHHWAREPLIMIHGIADVYVRARSSGDNSRS